MNNQESHNQIKYQNYKTNAARLKKAMSQGFYLEAVFIEYIIVEDRTDSILRCQGNTIHSDKFVSIGRKLNKIQKITEKKHSPQILQYRLCGRTPELERAAKCLDPRHDEKAGRL